MSEDKDTIYSHILKYAGLFGSIQALNIGVGLLRNKLVALILGPLGMGLASLFNSTIQLLCNTVNLGIPMSGVREVAVAYEKGSKDELARAVANVRTICGIMAVVGMLLCVLLARLLDRWTFSWGDHTLHFVLLSPTVGMTIMTGGEMAILKGMQRLKALARISVYQVFAVLFLSVPMYYVWGQAAIVPVISLVAFSQLMLTLWVSWKWRKERIDSEEAADDGNESKMTLVQSVRLHLKSVDMRLVRVGSAFVLSGVMASGADFLIRAYINKVSSLDDVGLFNAGFVLLNLYAGMVFASMETDYYPRLSSMSVNDNLAEMRGIVNRQVEATMLMIAPMLVALMVMMPIVMPVLYSNEFIPVVGMVQIGLLCMYFRAAYLPVEYISLARASSHIYLIQECVSAVLLAVFVVFGYLQWGLWGAGVGLAAAYLVELLFVLVYSYVHFDYFMSREALVHLLVQLLIGMATYGVVSLADSALYWAGGIGCTLLSLCYSVAVMRKAKHAG